VKISITEYILWCRTDFQLIQSKSIPESFVAGVSALLTIVDSFPDGNLRRNVKEVLRLI
jgi:hypothetical protein